MSWNSNIMDWILITSLVFCLKLYLSKQALLLDEKYGSAQNPLQTLRDFNKKNQVVQNLLQIGFEVCLFPPADPWRFNQQDMWQRLSGFLFEYVFEIFSRWLYQN